MTTRIWHRLQPTFQANPRDVDPDQFVPIALLATDDVETAFAHSQHVDAAWHEQPTRICHRYAGPPPRSTSVGDVIEHLPTTERFLVAMMGVIPLGPMPVMAIAPDRPIVTIFRRERSEQLPMEATVTGERWHGYALDPAYAVKQRAMSLAELCTHVQVGARLRQWGPAVREADDLHAATIHGEDGYAWIDGAGRTLLGMVE